MKFTMAGTLSKTALICLPALFSVHRIAAQTTITTNDGSTCVIPVYTSGYSVEVSTTTQVGNNVNVNGFVTAATSAGGPLFTAHQVGSGYGYPVPMFAAITDDPSGWVNYYFQGTTGGEENFWVRADGAAYFGNTVQVDGFPLGADADSTSQLLSVTNDNHNVNQLNFTQIRNSSGSDWTTTTTRVQNVTDYSAQAYMDFNPVNGIDGLAFGTGNTEFMRVTGSGCIGVGTASPGADLSALANAPAAGTPVFDVAGDITLALGSTGQIIFPDKTIQSTPWNGTTLGGDYAESVEVTGDRANYQPGDVIVTDGATPVSFEKATNSNSRMVAGVYSTKPQLVGRRIAARHPDQFAAVPMAMTGIVPTKVITENGPIEPGDLLVSSSTPGYAMKGTDRDRLTGAIIGKALAPLKSGSGVIEVLLALQ